MDQVLLILLALTVKHFVADFVLQTNWMIEEKGYYGKIGGIAHSATHGVFTLIILKFFSAELAVWLALLDFVVHYHIDWAKMKISRTFNHSPANKQFWIWFGADQMLHYITYIFITAGATNVLT